MRISWWVIVIVLAGLAVSARAEPSADRFAAWASAVGSPATQEVPARAAPAPGARASAGAGGAAEAAEAAVPRFALGVSSPSGWLRKSFGTSVYIGVGQHHAVRGNFARYHADELVPLLLAGGELPPRRGSILDLGLGWVWYPRRLWDGLMLEVGALRRERDVRVLLDGSDKDTTRSVTHAGRATIGWSWLYRRRVFVAAAVGASVGHESGHETRAREFEMTTTEEIDRLKVEVEAYLRFGLAFGR